MNDDPLMTRARGLWEQLAAVPVSFPPDGGAVFAASPDSRLCPPGWAGVVRLGDAALVTAPDEAQARTLRRALGDARAEALVRPDELRARVPVPVTDVLGPATLAYLAGHGFRPAEGGGSVARTQPGAAVLRALTEAAGPEDADESALDEIDSPAFVLREGGAVVAAAGYRTWPASTAHLCVLTDPRRRGRGLARQVASAATAHALDAGLLPQWRARPEPSRRVAAALGFRELGGQLSIRLGTEQDAAPAPTEGRNTRPPPSRPRTAGAWSSRRAGWCG
ncbi:GNAT family N-acetyltransferase [Streptomyces armeniacus]|uniref:GNAT family N-acetyltransferase n=1 Tax=Streptomyces armeniacus TaxID=83291 RepID=A0A345XWV2_9ACTN|nr:GNAT family N-acetyltransferase [Streptomyces armeniacus]